MSVSKTRARNIIERFDDQRILVIGDLMLDRYIYGEVDRISPEAPVPVVRVRRETEALGGSGNVTLNVRSLGAHAVACGVAGRDEAGRKLTERLKERGISTAGLIDDDRVRTTVKTRIIAARQQVVRFDHEDSEPLCDEIVTRLCERVREAAAEATAVIIEDYGKGAILQPVVDAALEAARKRGIPIGFDPKDNHALNVRGVTVATPNRREAFLAAGTIDSEPDRPPLENRPLREAGRMLLDKWGTEFLMITLGPEGMLLVESGAEERHVPTRAREVFDVSGAGDTVIATCLAALAAGAGHIEAAELANCAAGIVVGKLGTAVCSREELLEFLDGELES